MTGLTHNGSSGGAEVLVLAGPAGAAMSRVPPSAGRRYLLFGQPEVFFAGDLPGGGEEALRLCRECPLLVEVHDRTAIPEPPEFPLEPLPAADGGAAGGAAGGQAAPPESEGYVCGLARVPMLDLARGGQGAVEGEEQDQGFACEVKEVADGRLKPMAFVGNG